MNVYKNINWTKRNYECTNVVACLVDEGMGVEKGQLKDYVSTDESILKGLMKLHRIGNVSYYGYL